jgi:two-component system phosphate regulon response regulator PhoB
MTTGIMNERNSIHTVLVIEGKPSLKNELTSALTEADFEVADASDYFEALWRLDEFNPDLVLMNVDLPLLSGWEACYWLHKTFGIPIIMMGNEPSDKAWVRATQTGADFYLKAPFSYSELTARIKAVLRRYKKD